jgi:Na+:H+ antiporter, NhaA family
LNVEKVVIMLQKIKSFFLSTSAPGIILCAAAILGMVMENSPLRHVYDIFLDLPVVFRAGSFEINKPLLLWINDGLMAVFFLLVGLEIKRELLEGNLSSIKQAILPAAAAFGGLVVPALIYAYINWGNQDTINGWAIPAATDIAFALGVLMMLGNRVPHALKVILVAIAIIDDLAAVIIIAIFYTADISFYSLCLATVGLCAVFILNRCRISALGPYLMIGIFIWACVLKSGVHATLAGVLLGLLIPLNVTNGGKSPLKVLEHALHPWVVFGVLPLFAFANAGIPLDGITIETLTHPVTLGVMLGLFFGKQVGVMGATYAACRLGICSLPKDVSWKHFYGMSLLTGIGFTMSLFIGTLAFNDSMLSTPVRLGVISGSLLSVIFGVAVLRYNSNYSLKSGL